MAFVFPTYEQIVEANNRIVGRYGGSGHQVLNGGPLHYAIECIEHSVFGVELHPTIVEKACKLAHQIVTSHVFIDGNKRTAFSVLEMMLLENGLQLKASEDDIVSMFERMADGNQKVSLNELVVWTVARIDPPVQAGPRSTDS